MSDGLREDYEDLLKFAVVAPKLLDGSSSLPKLPRTVTMEHRREVESIHGRSRHSYDTQKLWRGTS